MGGCVCVEVYDSKELTGYQQFAYERGVFSRPFLNYMYDERFQDYRYYYNGDFMNQAGREKFMPVLWHDIQKAAGEAKL